MEKLNELAKVIVAELVDCGEADFESIEQYTNWTEKRLLKAFRALEQEIKQERIYVRDLNRRVHEEQQRAEAAEAKAKEWRNKAMSQCAKREVAESKLAELEKQERKDA